MYTPEIYHGSPENKSLEKESPFGNHDFQVPAVKFQGCIMNCPSPSKVSLMIFPSSKLGGGHVISHSHSMLADEFLE